MKDYRCGRLALFVALFSLFPSYSPAQENPRPPVDEKSPDQPAASTPAPAKFTDVTTALGINFEYLASHTSKKYLIETMGSGVANRSVGLFRLRDDPSCNCMLNSDTRFFGRARQSSGISGVLTKGILLNAET
jgi:hypothetical protein